MSSIAKTSTISISSIIQTSISLRLGISRPLAIVATGSIAKTTIAKSRVAIGSRGSIAISTIQKTSISFSLRLSLGLTLGNMDNTGRVGNISASTGISSGNSGESSRGQTGNSYRVGNIGDTVSGSNGGGKTSIAKTSTISKTSIAKTSTISKTSI